MYQNSRVLGLILARGGSKSIPRKNIKLLGGKPLLAYTIERARAAASIDRLVLSTDDEEIAAVGRAYGAEVPFVRPAELAGDHTPDLPVFVHALEWLREHDGWVPDMIVHLRPTHPFRNPLHIDQGIALLAAHPEADAVWTVGMPPVTPYKMFHVGADGYLKPALAIEGVAQAFTLPRQQLPRVYNHYGQVDITRRRTILQKGSMCGDRILPIILEGEIFDIDSPLDWEFAEFLIAKGIIK